MSSIALAPNVPFRPAAPPQLDRDPSYLRMMFQGTAQNQLAALPRAAFDASYRRLKVLHLVFHGVNDPDAIKRVFLDNAQNYRRPGIVKRSLAPAIGDSLFNADGAAWRDQRRLMAPAFTPGSVAAFTPMFLEAADRAASRWAEGDSDRLDMAAEATRTTLEVIDRALFTNQSDMSFEETGDHVRALLAGLTELRPGLMLGLELLDGGPTQRRARLARRVLTERMRAFVGRRAEDPDPPDDFITRLYRAFLQEHPRDVAVTMTLHNAMTFFVAGHETTANAVTWALYLLSRDRQAQDWAREEACEAWESGASPDEVLERLPYLKMVWDETLRLYPPIPRIDREAAADDELCGQPVRKGELVSIWPWVLHRHRGLWAEPELFNPENFDPEARASHHRYQYIPFGAGPRICIGMGFAQAEGLILLSRWLSRFRFRPATGHVVEPWGDVTVRPRGGLPLVVERVG